MLLVHVASPNALHMFLIAQREARYRVDVWGGGGGSAGRSLQHAVASSDTHGRSRQFKEQGHSKSIAMWYF